MHKLRDAPGDAEADLSRQIEDIVGNCKVYVLGLGNTDRADDGAGVLVALALKKLFPSYSYSEHDGVEGTVLDISERKEDSTVLFVDAADLRLRPGSIRIVRKNDIRETEISTHRVAVALLAALLEAKGKCSAVVCIQPAIIEFRGDISPSVDKTIKRLVRVLVKLMEARDQ